MTTMQWMEKTGVRKYTDFKNYLYRILREFSLEGLELPQHSATTFLDRMVKANRTHRLSLGKKVQEAHLKALLKRDGTLEDMDLFEREDFLERSRTLANILGLATVTSVKYAQGDYLILLQDEVETDLFYLI